MPELTALTSLTLGLLLGIRHALDADHIVAVSTIASQSRSFFRSALVGLSWGLGHTFTLFAVGFGVLVLKLSIPHGLTLSLEFAVGIMLVVMGVPLVKRLVSGRIHLHWHQHGNRLHLHNHSHVQNLEHNHAHMGKSLVVGMVHGLAGSGALIILVMGSMSSVANGLFFILLFGVGSIASMFVFGGLISLPFRLTSNLPSHIGQWVQGAAGLGSVILGLFIMWQVGMAFVS
ncbi:MAG: sulfite exporter TauE/SafE family protein [Chloroflexi bacterium]|nr:sulfite exporter TauE/SafE family protein [Chloroflexota bacterium]